MAVKSRRSYKGAPVSNTLQSSLAAGATSITVSAAMSGWPTGSEPFFCVIDPGTSKEEKVCVIYASTTTLTVVDPATTSGWSASANGRGADDTTDRNHDGGAVIYPVFTALEANQANELVSKYAHQGAIVHQGASTFTELTIGSAGQVLKVNSGATAPEWGQVATAGIADDAITSAKIASGAIVNDDINASAAIALSKLATGALPSGITVASANLVDGTVAAADIATAALKLLCPVGTIAAYGGTSAPTGWLLCDGASISAGYTELIALVGANTPNMKGRVAVGRNTSDTDFNDMFETGGAKTHTLTSSEMPAHQHGTGNNFLDNATMGGGTSNRYAVVGGGGASPGISDGFTSNTGGGGAHNNLQPYIVVNYIIKHDY